MSKNVGIAGLGAIGSAVASALIDGFDGFKLVYASEINPSDKFNIPMADFETLANESDLIIEALPPEAVPELAKTVFDQNKDLILISSCALLIYPEILKWHEESQSRIIVPSGALIGLDGVNALKELGIKKSKIISTKPPMGFAGAAFVVENGIDLQSITKKTQLFSGNALEAAKGFPANVNVAATLSLAGIGPEDTKVEIWADPKATGNAHQIEVSGRFSTMSAKIENTPDPSNPKSSVLAAQSIVSILKNMSEPLVVL